MGATLLRYSTRNATADNWTQKTERSNDILTILKVGDMSPISFGFLFLSGSRRFEVNLDVVIRCPILHLFDLENYIFFGENFSAILMTDG